MNISKIPKIIYKYKSLRSEKQLEHLIDILVNNRIYAPRYSELNDPFEGQIVDIDICGYAGKSVSLMADDEDMVIHDYKNRYRLLSFSSESNNAQLWAHYADNYAGICLCFSSKKSFSNIRAVEYCESREYRNLGNDANEDVICGYVIDSFYKKQIGWSYENEYRLIKEDDKKYVILDESELLAVIIGHNVKNEKKNMIISYLGSGVKKYKTKIGYRTFQVNILDYDYEYAFDGSELKRVDLEKELLG